jgi:hypothetical protein
MTGWAINRKETEMNVENFAEWLKRQGHDVIRTESSYWFDAGPRVYQAFPFGWIIQPSDEELNELILRHNILALRYSTPLDSPEGMVSYHVTLSAPYGLETINHKARNNIKRGLNACQVEKISFQQLAEEGWRLQGDTIERQNRADCMGQEEWRRICLSTEGLPGFTAWGAFVDGVLAASLFTARIGDTWYVPYAQCLQEYMCERVNHALFFQASCSMLADPGIRSIFFTLHSLDAAEGVNEFKFRMGHSARTVRQRVVLHPALRVLVNRFSYQTIASLSRRHPGNNFLSKTEGMLRFYVRGKEPLSRQAWPACLAEQRAAYISLSGSGQLERAEGSKVLSHAG